jgi:hypothetical protein
MLDQLCGGAAEELWRFGGLENRRHETAFAGRSEKIYGRDRGHAPHPEILRRSLPWPIHRWIAPAILPPQ